MRLLAVLAVASTLAGCATYTDELNRGQAHYQANDYERALTVFRMLETDVDSFGPADRARYAYLHGMTAYRISQRPEARHWLALARFAENKHPGSLDPSWKARLDEAMADLDREAFGGAPEGAASAAPPPPPVDPPPPPARRRN